MHHLILAYDLSYQAKLITLARTTSAPLMIVINPDSGPFSADVQRWLNLIKEVEEANAARPKPVVIRWFGYVDAMPQQGNRMKTADAFVTEVRSYQRDYRVSVAKGSKTRVVVVNNVFVDDAFADGEHSARVHEIVTAANLAVAIRPSGARYRIGDFMPGQVMTNPGEALKSDHWQWVAASFVVCFEGNQPALRDQIGPKPKKANAVMITSASDREQAERLWTQGRKLGLSALAITERQDYQRPPSWWAK